MEIIDSLLLSKSDFKAEKMKIVTIYLLNP